MDASFEVKAISITAVLVLVIALVSYMLGQSAAASTAAPHAAPVVTAVDIRPPVTVAAGQPQPQPGAAQQPQPQPQDPQQPQQTVPPVNVQPATTQPGVGFGGAGTTLPPIVREEVLPSSDALTVALAAIGIEATSPIRLEQTSSGEVFSVDGTDGQNIYLVVAGSTATPEETAAFVSSFANSMSLGDRSVITDNGDGSLLIDAPDAATAIVTDGTQLLSVSVASSSGVEVAATTVARLRSAYNTGAPAE